MSRAIDSKVVEMEFDNRKFEQNVSTSLSTIEKLKKSLNFDGMSKGFNELGKSASNLNFSPIGDAIDTVKIKFSLLQSIALNAMKRIGDAVLDTGEKFIKSLSTDNIITGWKKFGEKTGSVGTLIAQGYDMDVVEEQLSKLAWFTDETSFEFTNMVESIAKFTAAGQTLPDSVESLMGVANWAAVSGQNAQTASRAMYQLSQAMGSGVMRKEDYKSIQNVSMDTVEFRQKALDAAVAMGTLKKNANGTYTSIVKGAKKSTFNISQFADHLTQEAWFTTDVMKEVYKDYAGAVDKVYEYVEENGGTASDAINALINDANSGLTEFQIKAFKAAQEARTWKDTVESVQEAVASTWMNTFEIVFGNYDEAKKLWTDLANALYDAFAEPGNKRNELLGEGLKTTKPYLDKYFQDTYGLAEEQTDKLHELIETYGAASDEVNNYYKELANGDQLMETIVKGFYDIQEGASSSSKAITMSSDQLVKFASSYKTAWTGNRKLTEEQVVKLKEIGETYGYNSRQMNRTLEQMMGSNYYAQAVVRSILSVGKGLDQITASDIDNYLKNTNKLTDEQIAKLKSLQDQYGSNTEQINQYLKSLKKYDTSTRLQIMGVLGMSTGLTEAAEKTATFENLVKDATGATDNQVEELKNFYQAHKKSAEAVEDQIDALSKGNNILKSRLKYLIESGKTDDIKAILKRNGATEKETNLLINLIDAEKKNKEILDGTIDSVSKGNDAIKETIDKLFQVKDEIEDLKGRNNLISAFWALWDYGGQILETVKKAFESVFPSATAENIYEITRNIREFAESLELSEDTATKLQQTFEGLFSIFKIVGQVADALILQPIKDLFGLIGDNSETILDVTSNWGQWLKKVADSGKVGEIAREVYSRFKEVLKEIVDFFKRFINVQKIVETYNKGGKGLAGVFAVIKEKAKDLWDTVWNIVETITGMDLANAKASVESFIDSAKQKIESFLPKQEDMIKGFQDIQEFIQGIWNSLGFGKDKVETEGVEETTSLFERMEQAIGKAGQNLETFWGTLKTTFDNVLNAWKPIQESGVLTGFGAVTTAITGGFRGIKVNDLINIAEAGAGIFVGWNVAQFIKSIKQIPDAINTVASSFNKFGFDGKEVAQSKAFKNFALSVLMLVGALLLLSKIDTDKIGISVAILAGTIITLIGVTAILNKMGGIKTPGKGLLKFAISIFLISLTLERLTKLSETKEESLLKAVQIISVLMIALGLTQALMSFGKGTGKFTGTLMAMLLITSIGKLVDSVVKLSQLGDEKDMLTAAAVIAGLMIALAAAEALMSFGKSTGKIAGAIGLWILVQALVPMVNAIAILLPKVSEIMNTFSNMGEDFWPTFGKFAAVIGLFTVALIGLGVAARIAAPGILALGVSLALISASVVLFGLGLSAISAGIASLTPTLVLFGDAFIESFRTFLEGLFTILPTVATVAFEAVVQFADAIVDGLPRIRKALVDILMFGIETALDTLVKTASRIGESIVNVIIAILDIVVKNGPQLVEKLLTLVHILLKGIADHTGEFIGDVMSIVINIIRGLADKTPELIQALVDLATSVFDGLIKVMEGFKIEDLSEIIPVIEDFLVIMGLLSGAAILSAGAIAGVLGIGTVIAEILLIMAALGGISKIPGIQDFLDNGADILGKIGSAIGKFIGGIGSGISNGFPKIGENLSSFMNNAKGFIEGAKSIDDNVLTGVVNLTTAIIALTGSEFISVIGGLLTGGILGDLTFTGQLKSFASGLKSFSTEISGIEFDENKLENIKTVVTSLTELQSSIEPIGGIVSWWEGRDDLGTFGDNAAQFAKGMKKYIAAVREANFSGDDASVIGSMNSTVRELSQLRREALDPIGGIVSWWEGRDDLGTFGDNAAKFARGMKKYIAAVREANFSGDDASVIGSMNSAVRELSQLRREALDPIGGIVSWWEGRDDLGTFGTNAAKFAKGMKKYITAVREANFSGDDASVIGSMNSTVRELAKLRKEELEPIGGIASWWKGKDDLGTFGTNAAKFAEGMRTFIDGVREANFTESDKTTISSIVEISSQLSNLQNGLKKTGGLSSLFSGDSGLDKLGGNLKKFGNGVRDFIEEIGKIEKSQQKISALSNATTSIRTLIDSLSSVKGKPNDIKQLLSGLSTAVSGFVKEFVDIGTDSFANLPQQARNFVESILILTGANYGNGEMPGIVTTASNTVKEVVDILNGGNEGAGKAGTNLFTSYDNSAQTRADEAKENIGDKVHEIGDHTVYQTGKEGHRIDESIMLWGEDGVEHLGSDEVKTLFGDVPVAWLATMIGSATGKSPEFYDTLQKLAKNGSSSMTTQDILNLYNEGGIELVQALIDGGSLKASDVTDKLREAILGGVKNGDVLNEGILKAYFELGGRLDEELAKGLAQTKGPFGDAIKKLLSDGAGSLTASDITNLYKTGGKGLIESVISGWGGDKQAYKSSVESVIRDGSDVSSSTLGAFQALGGELDDNMVVGIKGGKTGMKNGIKTTVKESADEGCKEASTDAYNSGKYVGEQVGNGLIKGMENKIRDVRAAAKRLGAETKAAGAGATVASPSKYTTQVGIFVGEGLIVGMESMYEKVYNTAYETGEGATHGMSDALSHFARVDLDSIGDNLTIRPVMDLTDIQNGVGQISSMMNSVDGYAINGSMQPALAAANSMGFTGMTNPEQNSIDKLNQTVKELANRPPKQITQNYTIVSDDPEEIYEYISTRMQNDVIREDSVWA